MLLFKTTRRQTPILIIKWIYGFLFAKLLVSRQYNSNITIVSVEILVLLLSRTTVIHVQSM